MSSPSGLLLVDKAEGPSSHDVVAAVRRAIGVRQVGHTGTLDPFASGLLLVCIGPTTRLAEYLVGLEKTYRATMILGSATDTDDRTGEVVHSSDAWRHLTDAEIRAALAQQVGTIQQLPPTYSAKKVAGERMYAAARRGAALERTPATVTIHRIEVLRVALPEVEFEVECSKGTYIRAIARDAGESLGAGGHLAALRRTRIGRWDVAQAVPMDRLDDSSAVDGAWIAPEDAVGHLPRITVEAADEVLVRQGGRVAVPEDLLEGPPIAMYGPDGALIGIGERIGAHLQPRKVLA